PSHDVWLIGALRHYEGFNGSRQPELRDHDRARGNRGEARLRPGPSSMATAPSVGYAATRAPGEAQCGMRGYAGVQTGSAPGSHATAFDHGLLHGTLWDYQRQYVGRARVVKD